VADRGRKNEISVRFLDHAEVEKAVLALVMTQHGVLSLDQLHDNGLSARAVQLRAQRSRYHRIHQSVYSLVPNELLTLEGRWMAAVLACGPGAILSHRSAAALHELRRTDRARIDVTVRRRSGRRREGIDVHRSTELTDADVTFVNGIACTSVARTLLDLAAVLPRRPVERAFDQAEMERVLHLHAIDSVLRRNPTHHGVPVIKSILAEHYIGKTPTVNELEEGFFAICRRIDVPIPEVNQWVDLHDGGPPIKADFLWREQRVIVETDGWRAHGTQQARQRDPRRDQRAMMAGWRPVRTTWQQVMRRPGELEAILPRFLMT
jgi:hypothetical protein